MTLEEAQKVFTDSYDEEVTKLGEVTPRFEEWFPSGRYGGQADIERRYNLGLQHVERYLAWTATAGRPATMPDGRLGIEYAFETKFGDVPVRGLIDHITLDYKPVDVKSGNNPGEPFQLGTYAGVIEQETGVKPTTGTFMMTKTGKETSPYDLTGYTQERLTNIFGETDELIKSESFDPDPEPSKCMFCSVRSSCEFSA